MALGVGANGEVVIRLTADDRALLAGLARDSKAVSSFGSKAKAMGTQMGTIGRNMTRYVTLPVAAAAAGSVMLAKDFDNTLTKIRALTGASQNDIKKYRVQLVGMAKDLHEAPTKLAEALYFVTNPAFTAAESLGTMRQSAKAAATGLGEVKDIAFVANSAVMAFGKENLKSSYAIDVMTAATREGNFEASELAGSIGDVIGSAAKMKVSFDQVGGAIAVMTKKGLSVPESVTSLNAFIMGLNKGTEAGAKYLDQYGLSYADLRKELATKGLVATMQHINKITKGNNEALVDIIPNIRALRALFAITGTSGKEVARIFNSVKNSVGDTNKAFKITKQSDAWKMKAMWEDLKTAGVQLGQVLLPVVTQIAQAIGKVVSAFAALPPGLQKFIIYAGLAAAAVGPLLSGFSKLLGVTEALGGLSKAGGGLTKFMLGMGKWGVIAGGAIAAISGITYAIHKLEEEHRKSKFGVKGYTDMTNTIYKQAGLKKVTIDGVVYWEYEVKPKPKAKYGSGGAGFAKMMADVKRQIQNQANQRKNTLKTSAQETVGASLNVKLEAKRTQVAEALHQVDQWIKSLAGERGAKALELKVKLGKIKGNLESQLVNLKQQIESNMKTVKLDFPAPSFKNANQALDGFVTKVGGLKFTPPKMPKPSGATQAAANARSEMQSYFNSNPLSVTVNAKKGTMPRFATGGVASGPRSGYPVMLHGTEKITPMSSVSTDESGMRSSTSGSDNGMSGMMASVRSTGRVAAKVGDAVASAVRTSSKRQKRLETAAAIADSISSLVDFINGVTEAIKSITAGAPHLFAGWKAQVKKLVDLASSIATVVSGAVNKMFPWTRGRPASKGKEAIDPKPKKKGKKLQEAAEMLGPIGDAVQFVADMSEVLKTLASSVMPAETAGIKANAQRIAKLAVDMAQVIATEINAVFPKGKWVKKKKKWKFTGGDKRKALEDAAEAAGPAGEVISLIADTIGVLQTMTEVDPRLFLPPAGAWDKVATIIREMVNAMTTGLEGITISDAVLKSADKIRQLADALMAVLEVMRGISDVSAGNLGNVGWQNMIDAANGMVNASQRLPSFTGALLGTSSGAATSGAASMAASQQPIQYFDQRQFNWSSLATPSRAERERVYKEMASIRPQLERRQAR